MADYNAYNASPTGASGQNPVESYFERMRRLQGSSSTQPNASQAQAPQAQSQPKPQAQPVAATPVTGTGKIPDPQSQPQMSQPLPAPQAQAPAPTPPPSADPFAAMGGGVYLPNGGWVPKDNPAANTAGAVTADGKPYAGAASAPGAASGGAASGNTLPAAYAGTQFTQYQAPVDNGIQQGQIDLANQILANPHTLSPQVLNQMKQKAMEDAILLNKQTQNAGLSNAVSRGFSPHGGVVDAQKRASNDAMTAAILGSNRDLDIQANQQNRTDELNALSAVEALLNGQQGRSSDIYSNILKGQGLQAGDTQAASQAAIDRVLSQFGMGLQDRQLALQQLLGQGGLDLDRQRLGEQGRQFDQNYGLNVLQFLEGQRQANNNLGLGYTQLNSNNNNNMMSYIMSILNGGV